MQQHLGIPTLSPHSINCQNWKEEVGIQSPYEFYVYFAFKLFQFLKYLSISGKEGKQINMCSLIKLRSLQGQDSRMRWFSFGWVYFVFKSTLQKYNLQTLKCMHFLSMQFKLRQLQTHLCNLHNHCIDHFHHLRNFRHVPLLSFPQPTSGPVNHRGHNRLVLLILQLPVNGLLQCVFSVTGFLC